MAHGAAGALHVDGHEGGHDHPGEGTYIKVAIVLAIITAIEVIIYYLGLSHGVLVTLLISFSAVKFVTVVGYFMHLKFDDKRLAYIFIAGLAMAFAVFIALDTLQRHHKIQYAQDMLVVQEQAAPAE